MSGTRSLAAPALTIFFALGVLIYAVSDGPGRLTVVSLGATVVCGLAYLAAARLLPKLYAPRLLILSYGVQLLALTAIVMLGLPLSPAYHPFEANVADAPLRCVASLLIAPAGTLLVALVWRLFSRLQDRPERAVSDDEIRRQRRLYLILTAVIHVLYWPATLEASGLIGYVGRILAGALILAPFLAGRDAHEDRRLARLWSFTILLSAGIGVAAGTRSKAFVPVVLFVAGFISAMPRRKRLMTGAVALLAVVPLIQLAGAVAVVRAEVGRDNLDLMSRNRLTEVFQRLSEVMTSATDRNAEQTKVEGVSRLLSWTNVVVPLMTPEQVPYRGLGGLLDEATSTFRVARLSGLTVDDLNDAGLYNASARDYGFTVNSSTSVEFTLAADGWSRGGPPLVLLFSVIAAFAMIATEYGVATANRLRAGATTILALPIAKAAFFDANTLPLVPIIRGLVVYTLAVAAMVAVTELVRGLAPHRNLNRRLLRRRTTVNI